MAVDLEVPRIIECWTAREYRTAELSAVKERRSVILAVKIKEQYKPAETRYIVYKNGDMYGNTRLENAARRWLGMGRV